MTMFFASSSRMPSFVFTLTLPGAVIFPSPTMPVDLVLLEQEFDALGQFADHLVLVRHHRGEIDAGRSA